MRQLHYRYAGMITGTVLLIYRLSDVIRRTVPVIMLSLAVLTGSAQRLSHDFRDVSLSDALRYLQQQDSHYDIVFIYNELEDFRVTTTVRNKRLPDAIRQLIGFYPVRMTEGPDSIIYVECLQRQMPRYKGMLHDERRRPIGFANVALLSPADSTVIAGGVSSEGGQFVIPCETSPVIARISFVGYKTVYRLCDSRQLGIIQMQPESQTIQGIVIRGQAPVLRREAGRIVFDTRHIAGAVSATDLLRYAPGVVIRDDDRLSLFGESGILLCINGKEQRLGQKDLLQLLRSMPASDVERIEIVQSPGAAYAAEGHAGMINLILKQTDDYFGGTAGYAHTQYPERLQTGGWNQGMHGNEATASLVYSKGRVATSLNMAGTWDNTPFEESNGIVLGYHQRNEGLDGPANHRENTDLGHIDKDNLSARWQIDYKASDRLSVGAYAMVSDGERQLDVDGQYAYDRLASDGFGVGHWTTDGSGIADFSSIVTTKTRRHEDTRTYALNANATQQFRRPGAKIDYNLDYYRMKLGDDRTAEGSQSLAGSITGEFRSGEFIYQNEITQTVANYSAKADATIDGLRFGSQYTLTRSRRQLSHSWAPDYWVWDDFRYDEQVVAAYAAYSHRLGDRLSIDFGARYEQTRTEGHRQTKINEERHRNNYGRLFPAMHIGWQPGSDHALTWSLSSRVVRPNMINVNPDTLYNDTYHTTTGNPRLKPTYLYRTTMGYTYRGVWGVDLYCAWQPKRMSSVSYLAGGDATMTTWVNAVDEQDIGLSSTCCFDRLPWMTAILTQDLRWSRSRGDGQYGLPDLEGWNYSGTLQTSIFFDRERRWTANLNAAYHSPEKDITRRLDTRYTIDAALQYRCCSDRLMLGLACRNLLASRISGTEYLGTTTMDFDNKMNYRQLRLTLTYNWGSGQHQSRRLYNSDEMRERVVNDF